MGQMTSSKRHQNPPEPEEAAEVQSLFRQVNERIEDLNEVFGSMIPVAEWVCECADSSCIERIEMPISAYEAIRANSRRFPIVPGHELPEVETVVEVHPGYVVVEKFGPGGDVAARNDPRAISEPAA